MFGEVSDSQGEAKEGRRRKPIIMGFLALGRIAGLE